MESFLVEILEFAVSIPAQAIFPAPWRSYIVATSFAVKQMVNIFPSTWCIGFLELFVFSVIQTIDLDTKTQVGITIKFVSRILLNSKFFSTDMDQTSFSVTLVSS
jgi:hypothetical protein